MLVFATSLDSMNIIQTNFYSKSRLVGIIDTKSTQINDKFPLFMNSVYDTLKSDVFDSPQQNPSVIYSKRLVLKRLYSGFNWSSSQNVMAVLYSEAVNL